ncbi:PIGR protein, partial [Atlantisia rogersi]|nr:PIGR protein [Atlantisia rogersi]
LIFTGLQAQSPDANESRSEGSTLCIQCPYADKYYWDQKGWCRMRDNKCEVLIDMTTPTHYPYTSHNTKGNVTIENNLSHRTMVITMTNLRAEDSGTYSCVSRPRYDQVVLKRISLNVFKDLHKWELDSLSVQCPYSTLGNVKKRKSWCRKDQSGCTALASTDDPLPQHNSRPLEGRILIQDNTETKSLTITMKKLQAQDSSVYWCELYRGPKTFQIMEVRLSVSKREVDGTLWHTHCSYHWAIPQPSPKLKLRQYLDISWTLLLKPLILGHSKGTKQEEDIYEKPEDIQLDSTERIENHKDDSKDLNYATLSFKSRLASEEPLYSNVETSQAHRKVTDENVEYAIIALK